MSIRSIAGARQRRGVDVGTSSAVDFKPFDDGPRAPWVATPTGEVDLAAWGRDGGGEQVQSKLLDRGAVLFRGFGLRDVSDFETAATALTAELYGGYGDLPRVGESANIYESTPYPADQPILFHSESSHLASWPTQISFFCVTPSEGGGETPLADTRAIADALDPEVLREFETKGLSYVRNFSGLDVSWQQFFQTEDRGDVEAKCAESGMEYEWSDDGGALRVRQPTPAVRPHPGTGDRLFFNQIQLHHPHYLPEETRESLRSMVSSDDELPRNVTFGDGTLISDDIAEHVLNVYWETCVMFPWQTGDIISLDNMRTAHARMPFTGKRKIAVAMAGMTSG